VIDLSVVDGLDVAYAEGSPCLVATASREGDPDIAFKGSLMIFDRDHLAWWERSHGTTLAHLRENPRVAAIYRSGPRNQLWRFFGRAELYADGDLRQRVMDRTIQAELDRDPERKGVAVLVRVDRVLGRGVEQRREE
jgi:hypothetical protein